MTRQPDAPRHVVASGADADTVVRRLAREGWIVREGFALPDPSWDVTGARLILHGRVADRENLQLAVLAAARGAGIVAVCDADTPVGRALVDDLSRRHRAGRGGRGPGPGAAGAAGPPGGGRHDRGGRGGGVPVAAYSQPADRGGAGFVRGTDDA